MSDLGARFAQHVITEIGEPPQFPELPPHPAAGIAHTDTPAPADVDSADDNDEVDGELDDVPADGPSAD